MDYISRDAARAIIEEQQKALCPIGRWGRRYADGTDRDKYDELQAVLDTIDGLPTADVAEVRWAEIKGFEGLYWVNQYGQVKNKNGDILKQGLKRSKYTDYKKVSLYKDGEYTRAYVHRLVAQAFVHSDRQERQEDF